MNPAEAVAFDFERMHEQQVRARQLRTEAARMRVEAAQMRVEAAQMCANAEQICLGACIVRATMKKLSPSQTRECCL